jgi:hypothetical protein
VANLTPDTSNHIFNLAADLVNNTSQHIFLTGKAGTGKTTFLKYIKAHTHKNAAIVAPTGVAAINAGGVTMHSFFQLPFGPFIPGNKRGFTNNDVADKNTLFKNLHLSNVKKEVLQELELLIIDEVSMVRCDMLDAMDTILRHYRKRWSHPFGGVQVLYIGDLYQLPPVMPDAEWQILQEYYEGPFFFNAKVVAEAPPLYIELKKIYRQNEQLFIDVLNRVRNNNVSDDDLHLLNGKYQPAFNPAKEEKFITLTTHNYKADAINAAELEKLSAKLYRFEGKIEGDFSDKALPTDMILQLKEGAQVMFVKNDSDPMKRYFNGKLATIKSIEGEKITVTFDNNEPGLELKRETWRNIRYTYNKAAESMDEEELGSFTQYPIRLAWAVTIHKSQGLTFEKAVIDAGASFAAGQVYVALSRCTSLNGLVLYSRILPHSIATDERVIAFAQKEAEAAELEKVLEREKKKYWSEALLKLFDWKKPVETVQEFLQLVPGKKLPDPVKAMELAHSLVKKAKEQAEVADKFQLQLGPLFEQTLQTGNTDLLKERMQKAIVWFANAIAKDLLQPLQQHIASLQYASKVRKYLDEVRGIEMSLWQQLQKMLHAKYGDLAFCNDASVWQQYKPGINKTTSASAHPKTTKPAKGSSQAESLALYRSGKSLAEVARMRNLAVSTIEGHMAMFIKTGEADVYELLPKDKIEAILKAIDDTDSHKDSSAIPVKEMLGDGFTYGEIRMVLNHHYRLKDQSPA